MTVAQACRSRQFWLVWLVLCLNVSAGIGVIGMASPMLQEIFGGRLLGRDTPFENLDAADLGRVAAVGAGFTGLLSLFNILGRFFWSWLSDALGRKTTYGIFFLFGIALYTAVPVVGRAGTIGLFCGVCCLILSMYGGGFAAVPAYLADLFGAGFVGAIHGLRSNDAPAGRPLAVRRRAHGVGSLGHDSAGGSVVRMRVRRASGDFVAKAIAHSHLRHVA
jgi:MFS family permease